jgi:hypothetical protein
MFGATRERHIVCQSQKRCAVYDCALFSGNILLVTHGRRYWLGDRPMPWLSFVGIRERSFLAVYALEKVLERIGSINLHIS